MKPIEELLSDLQRPKQSLVAIEALSSDGSSQARAETGALVTEAASSTGAPDHVTYRIMHAIVAVLLPADADLLATVIRATNSVRRGSIVLRAIAVRLTGQEDARWLDSLFDELGSRHEFARTIRPGRAAAENGTTR